MPEKEKFRSFEEVANILKEKKMKGESGLREEAKKQKRPISAPDPKDMQKYLDYATSLLEKDRPELATLLKLRYKLGWSHERIAKKYGKVKPKMVKELEKTAIERVKSLIASSRENKIPIIGGR